MPQMGLGKQAAMSGLLQGLIGGYGQQRQRSMEQERKGLEDQRKLQKEQLALLEKYRPNDPRIDALVDSILKIGGMPGGEIRETPLGDLGEKYERPMMQPRLAGETALRASPQARADVLAGGRARMAPAVAKPPSASSISAARREMERYEENIAKATERINAMRSDWKLGPEGVPKTPEGIGRKKEQERLDEWNKWNETLTTAQDSLARIQRWATEKGVTLKFGASALPTSGEVSDMSDEEVARRLFPNIR